MADKQTKTVWSTYDEEGQSHWAPESQTYASGEVLLNHLQAGWQAEKCRVRTFYHGQSRAVKVYYFTLRNGNDFLEMPVLHNPRVIRLIDELGLVLK
jgi:hypothetical protein